MLYMVLVCIAAFGIGYIIAAMMDRDE